MGSALVTPDLHAVAEEEWAALLARVVAGLAPAAVTAQSDSTDRQHRQEQRRESADQSRAAARGTAAATTSPPACSERTTRATGRSSATASCRREAERDARLAAANCPEHAIELLEEE